MRIDINDNIKVEVTNVGRKLKNDLYQFCIYLSFSIYEKGIRQRNHEISTRIKVGTADFVRGEIIGRSYDSKNAKDDLKNAINNVESMLKKLSTKKIRTSTEVYDEIRANGRQIITGRPSRGLKKTFISKMQEHTYQNIMEAYLVYKQPCKQRQEKYPITDRLLKDYFKNDVPTMDQITKEDLEGFKKWLINNYTLKHNTVTSYLYMIIAVFNHAVRLDIIQKSPVPEGFGGTFINGKRIVLSENEIIAWRDLKDSDLTKTEQVAKYSALIQVFTGMGYGEIKNIKHEHKKYDEDNELYYLQKNRNKSGVEFMVDLNEQTQQIWTKLQDLTGNDEQPFNLPSIEYMTRQYKKIAKKAGITKSIATYTFRHTYAVNWMNHRLPLEDLQKRLGHMEIGTTQVYAKISLQRMAETSKELESKSKMHQLPTPMKAVV